MNLNDDERLPEKYLLEAAYTTRYNHSEDCKETFAAFQEKRAPIYRGK